MTAASILPLAISALLSVIGGGFLGRWLTHRRLSPKSKAEARDITAAAMDKDWARFQREIGRLVKRLEDAEARAERAEAEARACKGREAELKARIISLEAYQAAEGAARQEAARIVAVDRLEAGERRKAG